MFINEFICGACAFLVCARGRCFYIVTEQSTSGGNKPAEVLNWPSVELDVGQITGVAVDEKSNPVILHRGHVKWAGGYEN